MKQGQDPIELVIDGMQLAAAAVDVIQLTAAAARLLC